METQKIIRRKKVMPVVAVIFDDQGRILLTQRNAPGKLQVHEKWQFAGGGLEFGEHPRETVMREVKEEIGVTIDLATKHPMVYIHVFKPSVHVTILAFPAKYIAGTIDTSHDRQTKDARWFTYEEIDWQNTLPNTQEIIDEARTFIVSSE